MQAYIERDDEVLLIEPYFDIFRPSIEVCGGKVITCPLRLGRKFDHGLSANEWKLDLKELGAKISPRTKAIVLNTPHNPTGKVFDRAELEGISELAREKDLLVISDEVVRQPGAEPTNMAAVRQHLLRLRATSQHCDHSRNVGPNPHNRICR